MPPPLPTDVSHVLEMILSVAEASLALPLGLQLPYLSAHSPCPCGCGSVDLSLATHAVAPAPGPGGTRVAADVELLGTGGESIGEVLVFVTDGYLSRLEVCTWDEPPLTLTHAHRSLCPCDR